MYYLRIFVKSFLSLFAIMQVTGMSTKNPFSIILFLILLYVFSKLHSNRVEGRIVPGDMTRSAILSVLFSLFTIAAQYPAILDSTADRYLGIGILLLTGTGLLVIYYYLSIWFLQAASDLQLTSSGYSYAWIPYLTVLLCLLCWLPYFLYEYPGVMTPDSMNQYEQVIGARGLSNHHPVVHTALIGIFYNLGVSLTGDAHFGLALYTIAQMFFMACVAGYVVRTLQKAEVITPVLVLTICFYALMPYNGAYAVAIRKDIPFAGCMTLFAAALMRFLLRGSFASSPDAVPRLKISEYFTLLIPYVLSGVLLSLLRANGWYALVLSVPLILITYRKWLKVMIPVHLILLVLVFFVKYPVMRVYEIPQDDFVESLSIPVQQIARVIVNGEPLTESEAAFVGQLMDLEQVSALYQPDTAEAIQNLIRENGSDYLETHKSAFFQTWFSIGMEHPKAYFDACTALTSGCWYPDVNYDARPADGICPNESGLGWQPVISGDIISEIKEILFSLPGRVPLYGMLWSMGFILWLTLLLAALSLRLGKPASALVCLPFLLLAAILCTVTPAAGFHHVYAAFYALPLLVMSPFVQE